MLKARGLYVKIAEYAKDRGFSEYESHFHRHYEIYYLLEGKRRYIIENEIFDVESGDIVLIPPMVMHKTQNPPSVESDKMHQRLLYNLREVPKELKSVFDKHFYRLTGEDAKSVLTLVNESVSNIKDASELFHKTNALKLLFALKKSGSYDVLPELSQKEKRIQQVACFIKEHCEQAFTLEEMAKQTGYSREYFCQIFKDIMGSSFLDYTNNMRIARALRLLSDSDMPINKISEACGFKDSNYFARTFKKVVGITPTQHRKLKI